MYAIRSSTQVTSGDTAVVGTKDALVRFVDRLQRMASAGESEYPEDIEAIIPFMVKQEQLYEWLRAESTDPVRPENLCFFNILGRLHGVFNKKASGEGFFAWAVGAFLFVRLCSLIVLPSLFFYIFTSSIPLGTFCEI